MAIKKLNFNGTVFQLEGESQGGGESGNKMLASRNVFDKTTMVSSTNSYVKDDGDVAADNMGRRVLTIPVDGGQTYCYKLSDHKQIGNPIVESWGNSVIHQYNGDTHIGTIAQVACNEGGWMFTVDDDATVIKVAVYYGSYAHYIDELMLERGSIVHEYEPYNAQYLDGLSPNKIGAAHPLPPEIDLPYNLIVMGDSISSETMGYWYSYMTEKYPVKWSVNIGVGSAHYAHRSNSVADTTASIDDEKNIVTNQANRLIDLVNNHNYPVPDVIVIHAGINDVVYMESHSGFSLGTPKDVFDYIIANGASAFLSLGYGNQLLQTMAGGLFFTIMKLRSEFPYVRIFLTTPLYRTTSDPAANVRSCNAIIKECASYLSIPVIDLTYESGITEFTGKMFLVDNLHPNTRGARIMADIIGHRLYNELGRRRLYDYNGYTLSGTVTDTNGNPVANKNVQMFRPGSVNTHLYTTTDENGEFSAVFPASFYSIGMPSKGIVANIDLNEDKEIDIVISPYT